MTSASRTLPPGCTTASAPAAATASGHECVADDVTVGKRTSFPRSVKLRRGEVVVFSYIVYKSRRDRDRVNAKVMQDPRLQAMMGPGKMPFDAKRMFFGGFKTLVRL